MCVMYRVDHVYDRYACTCSIGRPLDYEHWTLNCRTYVYPDCMNADSYMHSLKHLPSVFTFKIKHELVWINRPITFITTFADNRCTCIDSLVGVTNPN